MLIFLSPRIIIESTNLRLESILDDLENLLVLAL